MTERIYLTVPFAEKDSAKALGARWDQNRKAWWIGPEANLQQFAKWLSLASEDAPTFRDLEKVEWALEDIELMQQANDLGGIVVYFVPYECWKCHEKPFIFHAAINQSIEVTGLMYWPDILTEIDKARAALRLPRMGVIKPRFSRTIGKSYVSQGCSYCDALFGDFPLHEDFLQVASEVDLDKHSLKVSVSWPPKDLEEWIEKHEDVMNAYEVE